MTLVVAVEALRRSEMSALFEGAEHGGVEISMFVTTWPTGRGPELHKHPYPEVLLVEAGEAVFTVDGEEQRIAADHIVVVAADTSHRFHNPGTSPLRVLSVQPSPVVVQTDLV